MKSSLLFFALALPAVLLFGCGGSDHAGSSNGPDPDPSGLPGCADGNAIFSQPPVPLDQVTGWEPLGAMNPSGHTFPTDHQYLYLHNPDLPLDSPLSVPLSAPANIRVTQLYRTTYSASGLTDYSVFFWPCADVIGRFGHVGSISQALAAAAGPINQACMTYDPSPGSAVTQCQTRAFRYDAAAGEPIGTAGDGSSVALDWTVQDRRAAPLHFTDSARFSISAADGGFDAAHIVPASAYFTATMSGQVAAKIGRYDGKFPRTALPLGGTIAIDLDSTARGYWFNPGQPYPPESYQAALAPDYLAPDSSEDFSIGLSQPNSGGGLFAFTPEFSGLVNRAFETVRADGQVYCYQPRSNNGSILLRLVDPATLRLEIRPASGDSCSVSGSYAFGANAFDYKR